MSASLSRFVNVMSGGKFGRASTKEVMRNSDAKTAGMLNAIQAALDKHAGLVAPDPKLLALHQGLWGRLQATEGRTGKKLLDYLDDVATKAGQALKFAEAYAEGITPKAEERQEIIKLIRLDLGTQFKSISAARIDTKLKASIKAALDAIKDEMDLLEAGEPFSSVQDLDVNLRQLKTCKADLGSLDLAAEKEISFDVARKVTGKIQEAKANPGSEIGKLYGAASLYTEGYLVTLEKRKEKYKTDFNGATDEELLAIHTYSGTAGFFMTMNAVLLGMDNLDEAKRGNFQATIDICKRGLARLPDYPQTAWPTYRFEDGSKYPWEKQFVVGKTFQNKIFWSTGRTGGFDAVGISGPRLEITVYGKKAGKDIASMADAEDEGGGEILFPPGTSFKTLSIDLEKDMDDEQKKLVTKVAYIVVEEVE